MTVPIVNMTIQIKWNLIELNVSMRTLNDRYGRPLYIRSFTTTSCVDVMLLLVSCRDHLATVGLPAPFHMQTLLRVLRRLGTCKTERAGCV